MKKLLYSTLLLTSLFAPLMVISVVSAFSPTGTVCSQGGSGSSVCTAPSTQPLYGPHGVINEGGEIFAVVIGFIAVIMIVIAGLEFIMSGGESQKIATAKNTIIFAVVGIIIIAIDQALLAFVFDKIHP